MRGADEAQVPTLGSTFGAPLSPQAQPGHLDEGPHPLWAKMWSQSFPRPRPPIWA